MGGPLKANDTETMANEFSVAEDKVARGIVAAHRARLDWLLQVPDWEDLLGPAMDELGFPGRRQGIGLRAAVLALPMECKHDVACLVVRRFRLHMRSMFAVGICRVAGLERFDQRDLEEHLTERQWASLRERLLFRLGQEHRRYKHAQQVLFASHRGLVADAVDRIVFWPEHRADCMQEGSLALLQAIDRVDGAQGDLSAYAGWWIRRAIRNYLMRQRLPVYAPVNLISEATRRAFRQGQAGGGGDDVGDESLRLIALLHECMRHPVVSLDEPPGSGERPLREEVADAAWESPAEAVSRMDACEVVRAALGELTAKQREVLTHRFGLEGAPAASLADIALATGISRQQVSMREKRALRRLETALAAFRLEAFDGV